MKNILKPYLNKTIGINYQDPFHIEACILIALEDEYFSIRSNEKLYMHYFSWSSVVQIIHNEDGIEVGGLFTHKEIFSIVVKVGHILKYVSA